jgi:Fuc2NAc and GlcNAc transferase
MDAELMIVAALTFLASAAVTGLVRGFAIRHGVLDVPNARSSHGVATPRGGGLAVVMAGTAAMVALQLSGRIERDLLMALLGGVAVAALGFADDRSSVYPAVRLLVHFAAAVWAVAWIGGLAPLQVGSHIVQLGVAGHVLAVLAIVWTLNLFNFMDGIDGIAITEAVFIAFAGAALAVSGAVRVTAVAFGAACGGFLVWNWPPAKIFMGDVGSGYLGYIVAVLALEAARSGPAAVWVWLVLGGTFFVDATVTLVRRRLRGEPVQQAHRMHAYQWLARRWHSHLKVTLTVCALNLCWLLPWAVAGASNPRWAGWITLLALAPLALLALVAGAGRREGAPG